MFDEVFRRLGERRLERGEDLLRRDGVVPERIVDGEGRRAHVLSRCGRADDYHYHAAPLHLQSVLGKSLPIAYALDGYPTYGLTEPDGATPTALDAFNGHETKTLGYHYHASKKYPYVNGGFHGEVVEREQQVDPQPHAQPVREALPQMRGAKITGSPRRPTESSASSSMRSARNRAR